MTAQPAQPEPSVSEVRRLDTAHGAFRAHVFRSPATRSLVVAATKGDVSGPAPLLARIHSSCVTSETLGACDCDCAQQLASALARIAAEGRGIVFYLLQEGRGAGFVAKVRDRMIVQASRDRMTTFDAYERLGLGRDQRRYDDVATALERLGVEAPLRLLTGNPDKLAALARDGVRVESALPLAHDASPFNVHYLAAKSRSGHALAEPDAQLRAAATPGPVTYFDPVALEEAPRFVHVASYYLPIAARAGAPSWFRLHAYHDQELARDRVVLEHAVRPEAAPFVLVQREALLERFPLRGGGRLRARWRAAAAQMAAHGAGVTLFLPLSGAEPAGERDEPADPLDEATLRLVLRHLPGGEAARMPAAWEPSADDAALQHVLETAGVRQRALRSDAIDAA